MANDGKFLNISAGKIAQEAAIATSAGAGDAGKIIKLDGGGKLDVTVMPTGVGPDTKAIVTSEALAAGDFVNIHNSTGAKARKADKNGKPAHGFVLAAFGSGATATVYLEGTNNQLTGMTPGADQFLASTGARTEAATTTTGDSVQLLGVALSATEMSFEPNDAILLA
jgi:hypothetical protein